MPVRMRKGVVTPLSSHLALPSHPPTTQNMNINNHHVHQQPFNSIVTAGLVLILKYGVPAALEPPGYRKEILEFWKPWALLFGGEIYARGSGLNGN